MTNTCRLAYELVLSKGPFKFNLSNLEQHLLKHKVNIHFYKLPLSKSFTRASLIEIHIRNEKCRKMQLYSDRVSILYDSLDILRKEIKIEVSRIMNEHRSPLDWL